MGAVARSILYFAYLSSLKMIRNIHVAILVLTIGCTLARPRAKKNGPALALKEEKLPPQPFARAPPSGVAGPPVVEVAYKNKIPREAKGYPGAPLAPVAETAYKKNKTPREARSVPRAPLGVAAANPEPLAPVAEAAYKKKTFREARGYPKAPLGVAGGAPAAPVEA